MASELLDLDVRRSYEIGVIIDCGFGFSTPPGWTVELVRERAGPVAGYRFVPPRTFSQPAGVNLVDVGVEAHPGLGFSEQELTAQVRRWMQFEPRALSLTSLSGHAAWRAIWGDGVIAAVSWFIEGPVGSADSVRRLVMSVTVSLRQSDLSVDAEVALASELVASILRRE